MERAHGTKCITVIGRKRAVIVKLDGMHETRSTREEFTQFCRSQRLRWDAPEQSWYFETHASEDDYYTWPDAAKRRHDEVVQAAKAAGFLVEQF